MANEKRLISATKLAEQVYGIGIYIVGLRNGKTLVKEALEKYRDAVLREICKAPTVDAEEVVHGRWEKADDGDGVVCSNCREDFCTIIHETDRFNYCPNCGAKMDGGNEDG